jgi:hypothetical protein
MLKSPLNVPAFKVNKLLFYASLRVPPLAIERPPITPQMEDNGAEELLWDTLLGEFCGDDDVLIEPMTVQEVFNSVQQLLSHQKQSYLPRTFNDLSLLKQYTSQILKEGLYHLDKFTASRLVAQSNHIKNDGMTLARRIRALFRHYQTFGGLPSETRGGKRKSPSYLDKTEDINASLPRISLAEP